MQNASSASVVRPSPGTTFCLLACFSSISLLLLQLLLLPKCRLNWTDRSEWAGLLRIWVGNHCFSKKQRRRILLRKQSSSKMGTKAEAIFPSDKTIKCSINFANKNSPFYLPAYGRTVQWGPLEILLRCICRSFVNLLRCLFLAYSILQQSIQVRNWSRLLIFKSNLIPPSNISPGLFGSAVCYVILTYLIPRFFQIYISSARYLIPSGK